jgi:hypothetical protein
MVAWFSVRDKDYETFDTCDSITLTTRFFDFKLVLIAFLDWFVERSFKARALHLIQFVQLVFQQCRLRSFHGTLAKSFASIFT